MDRFWSKVEKTDGCWNWTGARHVKGYGTFRFNNRMERAHRVSYEISCGPFPAEMQVLHDCDNPCCVNPDHLFLGTNADNMADKVRKGRQAHFCPGVGETSPSAKLTEAQVLSIRAEVGTNKSIGERYGVSPRTVSSIKTRERWKHI